MEKIMTSSFFTGAGGIDIAFENTGKFEIVYANENDIYPAQIYDLNHKIKTDVRSIVDVKHSEIPKSDIYLAGFPCTDISMAGYQKGLWEEDGSLTRSGLYFELLRLIKKNKPRYLFIENVSNLIGHNNGETFRTIEKSLTDNGYYIKYQVMNAMHYGNIAQNRERIYIVGFRNKRECQKFQFPTTIQLNSTVKDIIDFHNSVESKYYYTQGKYANNLYEKLVEAMENDDINNPSIYQWRRKYVRKNQSHVVPCLTANQGEGGHNVCLIKTEKGIRKMTPQECFFAQGYPKTYKFPNDMSDGRLYKAAGNSVVVSVVQRIADEMVKCMVK